MKGSFTRKRATVASTFLAAGLALALSGCLSTSAKLGGGSNNLISGGAAGESVEGANVALETCEAPLGTVSMFEDRSLPWWNRYTNDFPRLGSTIPVLRLMVQQSNCFVIVERGQALAAVEKERALAASGELRDQSNFGSGQLVSADYTASPSVQHSGKTGGAAAGIAGSLLGSVGSAVAGKLARNEAATTLLLIDNRSGVQVSAATGSAQNFDFGLFAGILGGGFAGAGGYANTPEGKIVTAAFLDSYNQMVIALRNYKAQTVEGGLGTGGKLKVQQ